VWCLLPNLKLKSPPTGGPHKGRRQNKIACFLQPSSFEMRCTGLSSGRRAGNFSIGIDCSRKAYNLVTRRREGTFYPDEIEIQEAHSKHRKLDS
jgi:hypothetical protein